MAPPLLALSMIASLSILLIGFQEVRRGDGGVPDQGALSILLIGFSGARDGRGPKAPGRYFQFFLLDSSIVFQVRHHVLIEKETFNSSYWIHNPFSDPLEVGWGILLSILLIGFWGLELSTLWCTNHLWLSILLIGFEKERGEGGVGGDSIAFNSSYWILCDKVRLLLGFVTFNSSYWIRFLRVVGLSLLRSPRFQFFLLDSDLTDPEIPKEEKYKLSILLIGFLY